ncbi:branched-chain amino acid ABC transporter permease [Azospirillum doebereinerae]|uniref:Branched-chain amino acid ABC transporter permease n=1 Tax=Azospirillum doebereinerae TaxID=92933 RepID=A0A3S0V4P4_9PROT|nr:branched-chain amino acid ABC transporter permease [Azospirillum doebereinerae]RUQ66797.1 branched-chain amino acid ABC transporter permease [Azospirillum doebereinerae]
MSARIRSFAAAAAGPALLAALVLLPPLLGRPFHYHLGILVGINALLALSMQVMLRINQLSLAQAGFMGLGAYASALLTRDIGLPFAAALPLAGLLPALLAGALGPVLLRVRGVHFVLLTFALGEVIVLVFVEWVSLFGGNNGLLDIPPASLFGTALRAKPAFYALTAATLLAALALCRWMTRGERGMIVAGLAGNEPLLQSLGVDALPHRCALFAFSAFLAGLAGSLYAHYFGYISPEAFGFWTAVNALIMGVLGGVTLLLGPLTGAVLLVPLPELFRDAIAYQRLFYGLALMALLLFLPRGLLGVLRASKGSTP